MNNNETCKYGANAPIELLNSLLKYQGGSGRHKCPTCAYENGFNIATSKNWDSFSSYIKTVPTEKCSHGSIAPTNILLSLDVDQGGAGRHKCTNCAFSKGFQDGLFDTSAILISLELVDAHQIKKPKARVRSNTKLLDFIKIENENKKLGDLGELFIIKNEIKLLEKAGKSELAKRVKHVSVESGDGLGYDILSFDTDGAEKKIEVKTTRSSCIDRPFYLTRNEINTSKEYADNYYLYRLFDFNPTKGIGKYYIVKGYLEDKLDLEGLIYSAIPK